MLLDAIAEQGAVPSRQTRLKEQCFHPRTAKDTHVTIVITARAAYVTTVLSLLEFVLGMALSAVLLNFFLNSPGRISLDSVGQPGD